MPNQDVADVLSATLVKRAEGLICAYLFGSHARGDAEPASDVDVAALFEKDPPRTLDGLHLDLADDLAGAVGRQVAFIETCVRELRDLARPELIEQELREERFVAHTLQLAIQAYVGAPAS